MLKVVSSRLLSMIAVTTATVVMSAAQAQAFVVARNETLPSPDGARFYQISVPDLFGDGSPVGLRLRTLSYGGGTTWESPDTPGSDPIRSSISSGGFDPIITLLDSNGNIVSQVDDSYLLGNQLDPSTGRIFDAASDLRVAPGNYQLRVTQYDNFEGGELRSIEGFTDVTGSERSNQFTVQAHTMSDYLSNGVRIKVNGGSIRATLEPKTNGLFNNLFDLAEFGSFHHFNWLSVVEAKNFFSATGPGVGNFDPLPGGNNCVLALAYLDCDDNDQYRWYYDEAPFNSPSFWYNPGKGRYTNNDTKTSWGDTPGGFARFPLLNKSVEFTTYLAGVRSGDDGAIFANVDGNSFQNLAFRWRYTQDGSTEGGNITFFADDDPLQDNGGEIEFLGFLQPEDWTQERIAQLQSQGLTIAGLKGGSLTTPTTSVPEPTTSVPEPSLFTGLFVVGVGLLCKKKTSRKLGRILIINKV
jgi:hypothetical protein